MFRGCGGPGHIRLGFRPDDRHGGQPDLVQRGDEPVAALRVDQIVRRQFRFVVAPTGFRAVHLPGDEVAPCQSRGEGGCEGAVHHLHRDLAQSAPELADDPILPTDGAQIANGGVHGPGHGPSVPGAFCGSDNLVAQGIGRGGGLFRCPLGLQGSLGLSGGFLAFCGASGRFVLPAPLCGLLSGPVSPLDGFLPSGLLMGPLSRSAGLCGASGVLRGGVGRTLWDAQGARQPSGQQIGGAARFCCLAPDAGQLDGFPALVFDLAGGGAVMAGGLAGEGCRLCGQGIRQGGGLGPDLCGLFQLRGLLGLEAATVDAGGAAGGFQRPVGFLPTKVRNAT